MTQTESVTSGASQENAVLDRYSLGAQQKEEALCCPISYDPQLLKAIPQEILDKDYGCGDPTSYVRPGDHVLDLGSGGGKICYIAAQIAGKTGSVFGVDMNLDMLLLANKHKAAVAKKLGFDNTTFLYGKIQDLRVNLKDQEQRLSKLPITGAKDLVEFQRWSEKQQKKHPLVPDESIDVVLSNCVLNLVADHEKKSMFNEIYRVLKPGGRIAISDIVSDEHVTPDMKNDPELWSGCISGALREDAFLKELEAAGLYGLNITKRDETPWQTIRGIEFRSLTVTGFKGKEGPCMDHHQAVIYTGPFRQVEDDDNHVYRRGERTAVCQKTFNILTKEPYASSMIPVHPLNEVSVAEAKSFDCNSSRARHPKATKGENYDLTIPAADCCGDDDASCC